MNTKERDEFHFGKYFQILSMFLKLSNGATSLLIRAQKRNTLIALAILGTATKHPSPWLHLQMFCADERTVWKCKEQEFLK